MLPSETGIRVAGKIPADRRRIDDFYLILFRFSLHSDSCNEIEIVVDNEIRNSK